MLKPSVPTAFLNFKSALTHSVSSDVKLPAATLFLHPNASFFKPEMIFKLVQSCGKYIYF